MFNIFKQWQVFLIVVPLILLSSCDVTNGGISIGTNPGTNSSGTENIIGTPVSTVSAVSNGTFSVASVKEYQLLRAGNTDIGGGYTAISGSWSIQGCPLVPDPSTSTIHRIMNIGVMLEQGTTASNPDPRMEAGVTVELTGNQSTFTPYLLSTDPAQSYTQSSSSSNTSCSDTWQASIQPSASTSGKMTMEVSNGSIDVKQDVNCTTPCTFTTATWGIERTASQTQIALPDFKSIDFTNCTVNASSQSTQPIDAFAHDSDYMQTSNTQHPYIFAYPIAIQDTSQGSSFPIIYN